MNRRNRLAVVVYALFIVGSPVAMAAHPVYITDQEGVAIPAINNGKSLTVADVKAAILAGASDLGWVVMQESPGSVRLKLDRGKYSIVVDIPFDAKTYGLKYVSSEGLRYKENRNGRSIHSTYQRLTTNLMQAIDGKLSVAQM